MKSRALLKENVSLLMTLCTCVGLAYPANDASMVGSNTFKLFNFNVIRALCVASDNKRTEFVWKIIGEPQNPHPTPPTTVIVMVAIIQMCVWPNYTNVLADSSVVSKHYNGKYQLRIFPPNSAEV